MAERYGRPPCAQTQPSAGQRTAAAIAAAVLVATPLTAASEGLRLQPYWDPAHIRTYCLGETENVQERVYTPDECYALLRRRLAIAYAPKVLACLPQLAAEERRSVFAALIDASYNAGPAAVCASPMARYIKADQWADACKALTARYVVEGITVRGWFASAKDRRTGIRKKLPGLVTRRAAERDLCLKGAS
jgi:lysozyme